jgi:hypothetical protein
LISLIHLATGVELQQRRSSPARQRMIVALV